MKALKAALAIGGTLVAAQAHAAVYGFDLNENATDYYFALDTSTATGATARVNTVFSNVSIFSNGVSLGNDTISFSGGASQTVDPAGGRTLAATGAYTFNFNPAPATGFGTGITFATGTTVGDDSTRSDIPATLTVSAGAVSDAPEPGAWALMLGGLGVLGALLRIQQARRREDEVKDVATA